MKRFFLTLLVVLMTFMLKAQVNERTLGLRLGGNGSVNGIECAYQHGLSNANRLEVDLGFGAGKGHNRLYVVGVYHWVWNIADAFNWYVGPGATVGLYQYNPGEDGINIGVGGQIGLEYDFKSLGAPILLSLDARPMWDFFGNSSGLGWGAALGVRYILGEK
jgi:hypothetical protein